MDHRETWLTVAVYYQRDAKDVCLRARSEPNVLDPLDEFAIESVLHRWWGTTRNEEFREALVQAPLNLKCGTPTHLLGWIRSDPKFQLPSPIRFAILVPSSEFAIFDYNIFTIFRAGGFQFVEDFLPERPEGLAGAQPPLINLSEHSTTELVEDLRDALLRESVAIRGACLSAEAWGPLERVWAACPSEVRMLTAFYTQIFSNNLERIGRHFVCQYSEGQTWQEGVAQWRRTQPQVDRVVAPISTASNQQCDVPQMVPVAAPSQGLSSASPVRGSTWMMWIVLLFATGAAVTAGWDGYSWRQRATQIDLELAKLHEQFSNENIPLRWETQLQAKLANIKLMEDQAKSYAEMSSNRFVNTAIIATATAQQVTDTAAAVKRDAESVTKVGEDVKLAAHTAKDAAEIVKTAADTVNTAADTTKKAVEDVKRAAESVKTAADLAKTAADLAKTAADLAKGAADIAKTAADTAKATAESTKAPVNTAKDASAPNPKPAPASKP